MNLKHTTRFALALGALLTWQVTAALPPIIGGTVEEQLDALDAYCAEFTAELDELAVEAEALRSTTSQLIRESIRRTRVDVERSPLADRVRDAIDGAQEVFDEADAIADDLHPVVNYLSALLLESRNAPRGEISYRRVTYLIDDVRAMIELCQGICVSMDDCIGRLESIPLFEDRSVDTR